MVQQPPAALQRAAVGEEPLAQVQVAGGLGPRLVVREGQRDLGSKLEACFGERSKGSVLRPTFPGA